MKTIDADAGFGFSIARAIARSHGGTLIVGAGDEGGTTAAMSLSLQTPDRKTQELHAATAKFDYTGGFRQELIELSGRPARIGLRHGQYRLIRNTQKDLPQNCGRSLFA